MPSFGPPLHQHLPFRHRVAPVFVSLRPSATVAAWHPGPAAPFRGKASVRLVCGSAFARLHPRPGNGEPPKCPCHPTGSQPLLALLTTLSVCLEKCVADSGGNSAPQTILPHPSASTGPAAPSRITPLFMSPIGTAIRAATACHPSFTSFGRGSASPLSALPLATVQAFTIPPVAAGGPPHPKQSCQYAGPSDNRALCKVAEPCQSCRVYSPLRFAYGYIMQAIIRRAS